MSDQETPRIGLPLLQPAQAQKHVTVNEALTRLDALAGLVLEGIGQVPVPAEPPEGACWVVGNGAGGVWAGQDGTIAIAANGGWIHVVPQAGMRGHLRSGEPVAFDGDRWREGALTMTPSGAGLGARSAEVRLTPAAGTRVASGLFIPVGVLVIGATARVTQALSGDLASWSLGTEDAVGRFGSGLGVAPGSWARGMLSNPMVYWQPAQLELFAQDGQFDGGGSVTIALHWLELSLPH